MKKVLALVITLLLILSIFAGCVKDNIPQSTETVRETSEISTSDQTSEITEKEESDKSLYYKEQLTSGQLKALDGYMSVTLNESGVTIESVIGPDICEVTINDNILTLYLVDKVAYYKEKLADEEEKWYKAEEIGEFDPKEAVGIIDFDKLPVYSGDIIKSVEYLKTEEYENKQGNKRTCDYVSVTYSATEDEPKQEDDIESSEIEEVIEPIRDVTCTLIFDATSHELVAFDCESEDVSISGGAKICYGLQYNIEIPDDIEIEDAAIDDIADMFGMQLFGLVMGMAMGDEA